MKENGKEVELMSRDDISGGNGRGGKKIDETKEVKQDLDKRKEMELALSNNIGNLGFDIEVRCKFYGNRISSVSYVPDFLAPKEPKERIPSLISVFLEKDREKSFTISIKGCTKEEYCLRLRRKGLISLAEQIKENQQIDLPVYDSNKAIEANMIRCAAVDLLQGKEFRTAKTEPDMLRSYIEHAKYCSTRKGNINKCNLLLDYLAMKSLRFHLSDAACKDYNKYLEIEDKTTFDRGVTCGIYEETNTNLCGRKPATKAMQDRAREVKKRAEKIFENLNRKLPASADVQVLVDTIPKAVAEISDPDNKDRKHFEELERLYQQYVVEYGFSKDFVKCAEQAAGKAERIPDCETIGGTADWIGKTVHGKEVTDLCEAIKVPAVAQALGQFAEQIPEKVRDKEHYYKVQVDFVRKVLEPNRRLGETKLREAIRTREDDKFIASAIDVFAYDFSTGDIVIVNFDRNLETETLQKHNEVKKNVVRLFDCLLKEGQKKLVELLGTDMGKQLYKEIVEGKSSPEEVKITDVPKGFEQFSRESLKEVLGKVLNKKTFSIPFYHGARNIVHENRSDRCFRYKACEENVRKEFDLLSDELPGKYYKSSKGLWTTSPCGMKNFDAKSYRNLLMTDDPRLFEKFDRIEDLPCGRNDLESLLDSQSVAPVCDDNYWSRIVTKLVMPSAVQGKDISDIDCVTIRQESGDADRLLLSLGEMKNGNQNIKTAQTVAYMVLSGLMELAGDAVDDKTGKTISLDKRCKAVASGSYGAPTDTIYGIYALEKSGNNMSSPVSRKNECRATYAKAGLPGGKTVIGSVIQLPGKNFSDKRIPDRKVTVGHPRIGYEDEKIAFPVYFQGDAEKEDCFFVEKKRFISGGQLTDYAWQEEFLPRLRSTEPLDILRMIHGREVMSAYEKRETAAEQDRSPVK